MTGWDDLETAPREVTAPRERRMDRSYLFIEFEWSNNEEEFRLSTTCKRALRQFILDYPVLSADALQDAQYYLEPWYAASVEALVPGIKGERREARKRIRETLKHYEQKRANPAQ